jgi:hypothetical protein
MEPLPSLLSTVISPPRYFASSLEIESPNPVPPYFRLVVPSACLKASKTSLSLSFGIPMPLSETEIAMAFSWSKPLFERFVSGLGLSILSLISPLEVNLNAFDKKFFTNCHRL